MALRFNTQGLTAVVIYDGRLFGPAGMTSRWARSIEREFVATAKVEAPSRSGDLRAGIRGTVYHPGPYTYSTIIESTAPHSLYVLRGTTGPIMSRRMWGFSQRYPHLYGPRGGFATGNPVRGGKFDKRWMHEHGYAMRLRPGKGFGYTLEVTVAGQKPNDFFARAGEVVARHHPSLRGFAPRVNFWEAGSVARNFG